MPEAYASVPDSDEATAWWPVRPDELGRVCTTLVRGRYLCLARTPGGWPVHAVFHEPRNPGTRPPTFLFCAGLQGVAAAGTAAAANLITLLESGRDRLGRRRKRLLEAIEPWRLVVIPCLNMDGRQISPDPLLLDDCRDLHRAVTGCWPDGSPVVWPRLRAELPLPVAATAHPGGYPNAAGYSILHDTCPGHAYTPEAAAFRQLLKETKPDVVLYAGHAETGQPALLAPPDFWPRRLRTAGLRLQRRVNQALFEAGRRDTPPEPQPPPLEHDANLLTLAAVTADIPAMTFVSGPTPETSAIQQLDAHFVALTALLECAAPSR